METTVETLASHFRAAVFQRSAGCHQLWFAPPRASCLQRFAWPIQPEIHRRQQHGTNAVQLRERTLMVMAMMVMMVMVLLLLLMMMNKMNEMNIIWILYKLYNMNDDQYDQWWSMIIYNYVAIPWLITVYWFEKEEADFAPPRFKFGDRAMKRPHVHIEIQSSSHMWRWKPNKT